jgi:O-acetyl-ADP-ribose deacetylase (regulator of RNase III)
MYKKFLSFCLAGALILNVFTPNFFANNKPTTSFSVKKPAKTKKIVFGTFVGAFLSGSVAVAVKLLYNFFDEKKSAYIRLNDENELSDPIKAEKIAEYRLKNGLTIEIRRGEIADYKDIDMITNAANRGLICGSGICGAIFKLAGKENLAKEIKNTCPGGSKDGDVVVTSAQDLCSSNGIQYIVHGVAPQKGPWPYCLSKIRLNEVYLNTFKQANIKKCSSLLLCLYGAGLYGWSAEESIDSLFWGLDRAELLPKNRKHNSSNSSLKRIIINCFTDKDVTAAKKKFAEYFKKNKRMVKKKWN